MTVRDVLGPISRVAAVALVLVSCTADADAPSGSSEAAETVAAAADAGPGAGPTSEPPGGMVVTMRLNPAAVWDDGSPITSADLVCTYQAALNTPGSTVTEGYDKILSVYAEDPATAVVTFAEPYAAYKTLFSPILKMSAIDDCNDVSGSFDESLGFSGGPWIQQSFGPNEMTLVRNDRYWGADGHATADRAVFLLQQGSDVESAALRSGTVQAIVPQAFAGSTEALSGPNIAAAPGPGMNFEALYFQQAEGPLADPVFRQAFAESIDRHLILRSIYQPIFPVAELLNCGQWIPTLGPWCDNSQFAGSYDPDHAARLLEENGWTRPAGGFWTDAAGRVPEIRWAVTAGHTRRESTQLLLIPDLAAKGFNVVQDNVEGNALFQDRLPSFDYDVTMYVSTATPNPSVTATMSCGQVPSVDNGRQGANVTGWCNEEASALMVASDRTVDETARAGLLHQVGQAMVDDHVLLPLFQFPNIAAWRTDALSGPVGAEVSNYEGPFKNLQTWVPLAGGDIVVGAEQWPACINPVTACADSLWMSWMSTVPVLPRAWQTTTTGGFEPGAVLAGEPSVELL